MQGAGLLGALLTFAGLVMMVVEDFADFLPMIGLIPVGAGVLTWMINKLVEAEDRQLVVQAVAAGLLLRLGLALVIHYRLPVDFFAPDQVTYDQVGWRTLLYHRGLGSRPWQINGTLEVGYFYWNAFLYFIFGHAPIAPKIWNAFVGAGSSLLAYRLAGELVGREPARYSLMLTMFFPSLVLWSTLNLRDPVVLFLTLALFLAVVRLRVRPSALALLATVLVIGLLILFRDYLAVMVVFGLIGASFIGHGRGVPMNIFFGLVLFGLALFAYTQFGLGASWVESASFEAVAQQRQNLAFGGSAFMPDADVSTPLRGLQFLPIGLTFFLFSPFPWQLGSALTLMTLPEQIVWYALIPMVFSGGRYLIRHRYQAFGPILVFLALTTCVYALIEGNAGTAYRHRAQVLVFFLVMASAGLALRQQRRGGYGVAEKKSS